MDILLLQILQPVLILSHIMQQTPFKNIAAKGEIAHEHFILIVTMFSTLSNNLTITFRNFPYFCWDVFKFVCCCLQICCMWERVQQLWLMEDLHRHGIMLNSWESDCGIVKYYTFSSMFNNMIVSSLCLSFKLNLVAKEFWHCMWKTCVNSNLLQIAL